jgi:chromosome segregation ATPase
VPELRKRVDDLKAELQGVKRDYKKLEESAAAKDETIAILNGDIRRRDELIATLQSEKATLAVEKAEEVKERRAAQRKAAACERDCSKATKELRELKARLAEDLRIHEIGIEVANMRAGALEGGPSIDDTPVSS